MVDITRVLKVIAAHRPRSSVRLLDTLYGPQAKTLRTVVAAMMLDRKVTGSDKVVQYGNLRKLLLSALKISGTCIADEDAQFESAAEKSIVG